MLPASEDIDTMFAEEFDNNLKGIDPERAKLYKICEQNNVGITVMKGYAGGRLFDEKRSPFWSKFNTCSVYSLCINQTCNSIYYVRL